MAQPLYNDSRQNVTKLKTLSPPNLNSIQTVPTEKDKDCLPVWYTGRIESICHVPIALLPLHPVFLKIFISKNGLHLLYFQVFWVTKLRKQVARYFLFWKMEHGPPGPSLPAVLSGFPTFRAPTDDQREAVPPQPGDRP